MEVKVHHPLEDLLGSFGMGGIVGGEDKKIIHVDDQPSFGNHVSERVIHELLKCCQGVAKTEEHNRWFKKSAVSDECGLPLVSIFDSNIVVPPSHVELGEEFCFL